MTKTSVKTTFSQQHQQKVDELVSIAKEQGYITYEEINEILPMTFDSADQIDQVLIFLSGMDIQILNQSEVERQKERKKEAKELEGCPRGAEGAPDDPVRMYLKEMGSVPFSPAKKKSKFPSGSKKPRSKSNALLCVSATHWEAISIANT